MPTQYIICQISAGGEMGTGKYICDIQQITTGCRSNHFSVCTK